MGAFYMVFTHFSIAQMFRLYFAFGFILSQIHFIGVGRFRILGGGGPLPTPMALEFVYKTLASTLKEIITQTDS